MGNSNDIAANEKDAARVWNWFDELRYRNTNKQDVTRMPAQANMRNQYWFVIKRRAAKMSATVNDPSMTIGEVGTPAGSALEMVFGDS